jgi:hypothetical protein
LVAAEGSSAYQTWKFVGTAQPLVIVGVAVFVVEGAHVVACALWTRVRHGAPMPLVWSAGVAVAGVAVFALATSQGTWRETAATPTTLRGHEVEPALVSAGRDSWVRAQPGLRIALTPYFETMVAPVVLDLRGAVFGSPTYRGPASPGDGCSLTRLNDHPELDPARYHPVAGDLSIGPIDRCVAPPGAPGGAPAAAASRGAP